MRAIAAILLLAVYIRHGSIYWLSDLFDAYPWKVNYFLGAGYEAVLAGVIAFMLLAHQSSAWRNIGLGACAIAAVEDAQIVGCSLLIGDIRDVPERVDLCDYLVGFPIGRLILGAELAIVCYALATTLRKR